MIRKTVEGREYESQMVGELHFDQTPKEGSFNPVTSDAVVKAIDEAKEDMQEKIDEVTLDPSAVALGNVHLLDELTEFPADGCILIDSETNGPGEMSKDTLLELTAQNALAGNVVEDFIPNTTDAKVGKPYVCGGDVYIAAEDYRGSWNVSKFYPVDYVRYLDDEQKVIEAVTGDTVDLGSLATTVVQKRWAGDVGSKVYLTSSSYNIVAVLVKIKVDSGYPKLKATISILGGADKILFLDEDSKVVGKIPNYTPLNNTTLEIPSGTSYLCINYDPAQTYSLIASGSIGDYKKTRDSVTELNSFRAVGVVGTGAMTFTSSDFEQGGIDSSGVPYTNNDLLRSKNFIFTDEGAVYSISITSGYRAEMVFYDRNKTFVKKLAGLTTSGTYTAPENAYYCKFSFLYPSGNVQQVTFNSLNLSVSASGIYGYTQSGSVDAVKSSAKRIASLENLRAIGSVGPGAITYTSSDFVHGQVSGTTGAVIYSDKLLVNKEKQNCIPGAVYTYSMATGYRIQVAYYRDDGSFIRTDASIPATSGTFTVPFDAGLCLFCLLYPSGSAVEVVFDNLNFSLSCTDVPGFVRSMPYNKDLNSVIKNYFNLELPIYATRQEAVNGSVAGGFDVETDDLSDYYDKFDSLIASLPAPDSAVKRNPKIMTEYYKVGTDASGTYTIKAYVIGKRNRFGWLAAERLFAWKNGSTIVYVDSCTPRAGDVVYSDSSRTDSGYAVTSYNSATQKIVVNSVEYTRSMADNVAPVVVWSTDAGNVSAGSQQITLYSRDGWSSIGTATRTDSTHITYNGVTYERCDSFDFYTKHKGTIVVWANEHGPQSDPMEGAVVLYQFAKDLACGNCSGNEFIQFIKENYKVVVVPIVNPYGLSRFLDGYQGRNNYNNVNINRNYDTPGWSSQADADKGSAAGDQPETQFVMNLVMNMEAGLAVDIHVLGYVTAGNIGRTHYEGFIPSADLLNYAINTMLGYSLSLTSYGDADPSTKAQGADWINFVGVSGGLIEMNAGDYAASYDGHQHGAMVVEADYSLLLNMLRVWLYGVNQTLSMSRLAMK